MLIGPAGAGKTTFAATHFEPDEILSSDAFRAIVSGDEADQNATRAAFSILHREVTKRLAARRMTVVDATNVEVHARRALLARARVADIPAVAIVFDLPPHVVHARNLARTSRVVEPTVVSVHLALLRRAVQRGLLDSEGFTAIHRLRSQAEFDLVRIERRPGPMQ